jgi:hypothetical protein
MDVDSLVVTDILDDQEVLAILARHQIMASTLAQQETWPNQKPKVFKNLMAKTTEELKLLDTKSLASLFKGAVNSQSARYKFWDSQLGSVENHPAVRMALSEERERSRLRR